MFESHMSLLNFFQHDVEPDFHFDTEFQLDSFLHQLKFQEYKISGVIEYRIIVEILNDSCLSRNKKV